MLYEKLGIEKKDYHLITTVYSSYFSTGMICTILGAVLPYLKDAYNLNYWLVGNLYSFHQIGNLCSVFLTGILPYFIGRKKTTSILYSFTIFGVIFITIFGTPWLLLLSFAMTGIGRGVISNMANVEVLEKTKNKTAGLNILHAIFAIGAFFAPFLLLVASKFSENFGWKVAFWFIAAFYIVVLFNYIGSTLRNTKEERKTTTATGEKIVPFYKSFDYWLTTLIMLFYLCEETGSTGWLVTFFKDSEILTPTLAGITTSVLWLSVMAGRFVCALVSGRIGKIRLLLILAFSNLASFILMIATKNVYVCFAGIVLTGFTMSGLYPTTVATMKLEYSSSPLSAGIAMGVSILGGIFMPSIVGAVAEKSGVTAGISTIAVALGIMTALIVLKAVRKDPSTAFGMTTKYDSIILDIDGTIWDTTELTAIGWNAAIEDFWKTRPDLKTVITKVTAEMLKKQFGKPMNEIARSLWPNADEKDFPPLLKACYENEHKEIIANEKDITFPEIVETIKRLAPKINFYIVSNCQCGYIEITCEKTGIKDCIKDSECFGNTGKMKDENIRILIERNNLKNPVYIGDTKGDELACKKAGVSFVWAAYGFGEADEFVAKLERFGDLEKVIF